MPKPPLLVQLVFHPRSESARELARHIHRELNDDVVVPGLRVPTIFCPEVEGDLPPEKPGPGHAERCFVVPLADNILNNDDGWCSYVAETWLSCQGTPHRCVPVQLDTDAWPLDKRLGGVNFVRAFVHQGEARKAFVVRRIVTELCRYLLNLEVTDDKSKVPVTVFLSHAKVDINEEPKVVENLVRQLSVDKPVEAWVDSGEIEAGSKFAEAIQSGVGRTSLLVVLTDRYATREWCRKEVLLAKQNQRPMVVVDALTRHEVRSFPYLGNVPVVRWDAALPERPTDLLLKETLRNLHVRRVLDQVKKTGDELFVRPPELALLVGLGSGTNVLYPDPPLGVGEKELLGKTGVRFETPLERLALVQPLKGKVIGMSMSESTDGRRRGLDPLHLEASILDLARYLLVQGAKLAYGGHLAKGGYTDRLLDLVRTHNQEEGVQPFDRVITHLGWPLARLTDNDRSRLKWECTPVERPRPADVDESLHPDLVKDISSFLKVVSPAHRFAWARGMTEMREYQADASQSKMRARIVLGGTFGPTIKVAPDGTKAESWYLGRIPGVLEEVMLSVKAGQPVFLIGGFGGVAGLVIDLLQGRDRPEATWDYQRRAPFAPEMRELYTQRGVEWWDYPDMIALLRKKGVAGINPLLSEPEHRELFETTDTTRMVELILLGLGRLN